MKEKKDIIKDLDFLEIDLNTLKELDLNLEELKDLDINLEELNI